MTLLIIASIVAFTLALAALFFHIAERRGADKGLYVMTALILGPLALPLLLFEAGSRYGGCLWLPHELNGEGKSGGHEAGGTKGSTS